MVIASCTLVGLDLEEGSGRKLSLDRRGRGPPIYIVPYLVHSDILRSLNQIVTGGTVVSVIPKLIVVGVDLIALLPEEGMRYERPVMEIIRVPYLDVQDVDAAPELRILDLHFILDDEGPCEAGAFCERILADLGVLDEGELSGETAAVLERAHADVA